MGKNKYIETPEKLWEYFVDYKKKVKGAPFKIKDWVGKDGDQVHREKERPLTMEGFECSVPVSVTLDQYFSNRDNRYADYVAICSRIRKEIRMDQIEGGMAGMYNPSITQRINGLVDKAETTLEVKDYKVSLKL